MIDETSSRAAVASLQTWCNWQGARLVVDGLYGPKTRDVVKMMGAKMPAAPSTANPTARAAITLALEALGEEEIDDGNVFVAGSPADRLTNGWAEFRKAGVTHDLRPPYCAIFASAAAGRALFPAAKSGAEVPWKSTPWGTWFGAVADWDAWSVADGREYLRQRQGTAEVGTIYTMNRQGSGSDPGKGGHCGFVLGTRGSRFLALDANLGGAVRLTVRHVADARRFVRWWVTL